MKMKNILFTGLLGLCTFTGCDYLDFDESVGYEKENTSRTSPHRQPHPETKSF